MFHLMERISTVYDIDRSRYKTMKELIPWLFDKVGLLSSSNIFYEMIYIRIFCGFWNKYINCGFEGLLSLSCMIHKNKNPNFIVSSAMTGPFS